MVAGALYKIRVWYPQHMRKTCKYLLDDYVMMNSNSECNFKFRTL
jgi:hypothetical protein